MPLYPPSRDLRQPPQRVALQYRHDGAHIFISPTLPGFLAAGDDFESVFAAIVEILEEFTFVKFHKTCRYKIDADSKYILDHEGDQFYASSVN